MRLILCAFAALPTVSAFCTIVFATCLDYDEGKAGQFMSAHNTCK